MARAALRAARARARWPRLRRSSLGDRLPDVPGGMFGGRGLARPQPAPRRHGRDRQPALLPEVLDEQAEHVPRRHLHRSAPNRRRARSGSPAAKPRREQIYFIGATNVPIDVLDPALTRPGRMGRHVWFRTPTKQDRLDILDLYIGKVAHSPRARPAEPPRGDRPRHERLLAGHDRAGHVDGADDRAPLRVARLVRVGRPRRGDDDARGRHRGRASSTCRQESRAVAIHEAGHAARATST